MNETENLGGRLAEARKLAGLSQTAAAKLLDIRRPAISEMESGKRKIKANELTQLANIYGVSVKWLSTGESEHGISPKVEMIARSLSKLKDDDLAKLTAIVRMLNDKD